MSWPTVLIDELVTISGGGTPRRDNEAFFHGDIPWVTPKDMKRWEIAEAEISITEEAIAKSATKLLSSNTVLVVVRSGVLKHTLPVAINRRPVAINQDMKSLQCNERVTPEYLARFLKFSEPQILSWVRATTADNFSVGKLRELPIPLPPLAEQRRIAAILDQADDLRRKRRQALLVLQNLKFVLFEQMFLRQESRDFPVGTIRDLTASAQYGTSSKAFEQGQFPILRMGNLTYDGDLDFGDLKYIDLPRDEIEKYTVLDGDILFNRTNSPDLVGKTAVFRADRVFAFAGYLVRLRTNERAVPEFISGYLNSKRGKAILRGMCKAIIGMANINAKELQSVAIPLPPIGLQRAFAARVAEIDKLKAIHRAHLEKLDALFASLQHRAFRGEVTGAGAREVLREMA